MVTVRQYCLVAVCVAVAILVPAAAMGQTTTNATGGGYAGVHVGFGSSNVAWTASGVTPFDISGAGLPMGVFGGYNIGRSGNLVYGAEGEVGTARTSGSVECPNPVYDCESSVNRLISIRGRAGYATGSVLVYGTAGFGTATVRLQTLFEDDDDDDAMGSSQKGSGLAAGVGVEAPVGNRVSVRGEFLRVGLGSTTHTGLQGPDATVTTSIRIVRVGVSVSF